MTNGVDDITLIGVTVMLVAMFSVTVVLYALRLAKGRKYKKKLHELDVEKNKIESTPIMSELSKIEGYLENEKLNILYTEWKDRFNDLKDVQISKITDMLLEADYTLNCFLHARKYHFQPLQLLLECLLQRHCAFRHFLSRAH